MAVIVDIAGRGQCRDVTAGHGALICKAQVRPSTLMANCGPPLMRLHAAHRSDCNPAMMGVGVGHHPLRPVEQHQAGTSFGLDQPPAPGRLRGHLRYQRTEILLVGSKLHQEPPHLGHIDDVSEPQLIKPSQKMPERAREIVTVHRPPPHPRSTPQLDAYEGSVNGSVQLICVDLLPADSPPDASRSTKPQLHQLV